MTNTFAQVDGMGKLLESKNKNRLGPIVRMKLPKVVTHNRRSKGKKGLQVGI
jgi:hypothetical protein